MLREIRLTSPPPLRALQPKSTAWGRRGAESVPKRKHPSTIQNDLIMNDRTQYRARVQSVLGADFARKATDAFCSAFVQPSPEPSLGDDGFPLLMRVVVEMPPQPAGIGWLDAALAKLRSDPAREGALNHALSALPDAGSAETSRRVRALLSPAAILRRSCTLEKRERHHRAAAPLRAALEDAVSRSFSGSPMVPGATEPAVQFCWTNQTFLVWVDPRELAVLAGDPLVHQIDVPRRVDPQIKRTGETVGAVRYRAHFSHTGAGVVVAVIDSEVAQLHSVFQDRVQLRCNFTSEAWGNPGKHGTAVAAIIAAKGPEAEGMAPGATIYSYKVVKSGDKHALADSHYTLALDRAAEDEADIANCSWNTRAFPDGQSRESRACDTVWACGMTVVASMGNKGPCPESVQCPADARGAIAVGATDALGLAVEEYSARGPSKGPKRCPDLVAPGGSPRGELLSYLQDGTFGECDYGTSFAAPHVSGVLALLLERTPGMTPDDQLRELKRLCRPISGRARDRGCGLCSLSSLIPPDPPPP